MLIKNRTLIVSFLSALVFTVPVNLGFAGIMLDSVPQADYVAYANETQFNAIGQFVGGSSGTLIAPNWVLTAGHLGTGVTGFRIRGTGTTYSVAQVIQHPNFILNSQNINLGFDLQLVRLSTEVVGVTPASIYRGASEVGKTAAITGFGIGRHVSQVGDDLPAAQRAGTNVIDAIVNLTGGAQQAMLIADFDSGLAKDNTLNTFPALFGSSQETTSLEYHLAAQDSGGGMFIQENGNWFLAGVNSGIESQRRFLDPANADLNLNGNNYGFGAISYMTRVSSFTGFIDTNITAVPEPASLSLVGIALAIGILGRSRMRNATTKRAV